MKEVRTFKETLVAINEAKCTTESYHLFLNALERYPDKVTLLAYAFQNGSRNIGFDEGYEACKDTIIETLENK